MTSRIKYPLTGEAKTAAVALANAWEAGIVSQICYLDVHNWVDGRIRHDNGETALSMGAVLELDLFGLVDLSSISGGRGDEHGRWELLLLQELKSAVKRDFDVSDFFLTTSAVGSIVILGEGAQASGIQSIAINYGAVYQSIEKLADQLSETLGEELLRNYEEIQVAVDNLRESQEVDKVSRVGQAIEALGRYLAHAGSTASVISGIQMLAQYLR